MAPAHGRPKDGGCREQAWDHPSYPDRVSDPYPVERRRHQEQHQEAVADQVAAEPAFHWSVERGPQEQEQRYQRAVPRDLGEAVSERQVIDRLAHPAGEEEGVGAEGQPSQTEPEVRPLRWPPPKEEEVKDADGREQKPQHEGDQILRARLEPGQLQPAAELRARAEQNRALEGPGC